MCSDGETVNYPDTIRDFLQTSLRDLNRKMREADRVPAPGASVKIEFDDEAMTFYLVIDTVPAS